MKSIALKVERAFDLAQNDEEGGTDDEMTALLTRAIRMDNTAGKRSFRGTSSNKEMVCYHCQKKGHMAKNCFSKKAGEPPAQKSVKAMIAACGESDEDSEDEKNAGDVCIMATSEVTDTDLFDSLSGKTNDQLIACIKVLVKKNVDLNKELLNLDERSIAIEDNGNLWTEKAMKLEEELAKSNTRLDKRVQQLKKETEKLKHLEGETERLNSQEDSLRMQLAEASSLAGKVILLTEENARLTDENSKFLRELELYKADEDEKKRRWLREHTDAKVAEIKKGFYKTFKAKPGLGYNEETEGKDSVTGKKADIERAQTPQCRCGTRSKGKELVSSTQDTVPFDGAKAHALWTKHKEKVKSSGINFAARIANKSIPRD